MDHIVQIFKALGDETRLKILVILSQRRICAKGIAKHLEITEATVSQHMKILKEAGIIIGEKTGYHVHYNIQKSIFPEIRKFLNVLNDVSELDTVEFKIYIPNDCKAVCKATQHRCCHKKF